MTQNPDDPRTKPPEQFAPRLLQGFALLGMVLLVAFHFLQFSDPAHWGERVALIVLLAGYIAGVGLVPWLRDRALGAFQLLCCLLSLWMVANSVRLGFVGDGMLALIAGFVAISLLYRDSRRLVAYWLFVTAAVAVGMPFSARTPEVTAGTLVVTMLTLASVSWLAVRVVERTIESLRAANRQLSDRNAELKRAMAEIRILRGILPICSHCKKIRDDQGYWNQLEAYINRQTGAEFTHGICPECAKKLYPQYADRMYPKSPDHQGESS
jgi:hypothetical protein